MRHAALLVVVLAGCLKAPPFAGKSDAAPSSDTSDARLSDALLDGPPLPATNLVFVTSTTTTVETMGGLSGANMICHDRAMAAGLGGTYVAWLSAGSTSAKARLGSARGWRRTDGKPFTDRPDDLAAGIIWYPPRFDEFGNDAGEVLVMTATQADGTPDSFDCNGLTTGSTENISAGGSTSTHRRWTFDQVTVSCTGPAHLYCFGTDLTVPLQPSPATGRKAFLSPPWTPTGGVGTANAACGAAATAAGLTGTFAALLSSSAGAAASQFDGTAPPWVRVDGIPLAQTAAAVLAGNLETTLDVDASGNPLTGGDSDIAWTGAGGAGTPNDGAGMYTCSDWTDGTSSSTGRWGDTHSTTSSWFLQSQFGCQFPNIRLYCLEK